MSRLNQIIDLQHTTFLKKVHSVFLPNLIINEEQAAQYLADLVFAEQTKRALGTAAMTVLNYDQAKDWLQTLFLTAISLAAQARGSEGLRIEALFLDAWLESGRTLALSGLENMFVSAHNPGCNEQVGMLFTGSTGRHEIRALYRVALSRHVLTMAQKHPDLLVEKGLFAGLS